MSLAVSLMATNTNDEAIASARSAMLITQYLLTIKKRRTGILEGIRLMRIGMVVRQPARSQDRFLWELKILNIAINEFFYRTVTYKKILRMVGFFEQ